MRRTTKAGAVTETILILAGLALLIEGFLNWSTTYKFINGAEHGFGTVNGMTNAGFTLNVLYTPGQAADMVFSQTGLFFGYSLDQHVPILFDPENPAKAVVNKPAALWFKPALMIVPGFLFVLLGFKLRGSRNL